jgi:hypothetical protein
VPVHQDQCSGFRYIQLFSHSNMHASFLQTEENAVEADRAHNLGQDTDPFNTSGVLHDPQAISMQLAQGKSVVVPKDESAEILRMLD